MNSTDRATEGTVRTAKSTLLRRSSGRCLSLWLLLLSGVALLEIGATTNPPNALPATRQFEVPPETSLFKHEEMQRIARENNERYRVRIDLPPAAFDAMEQTNTYRRARHYAENYNPADQFTPHDLILWLPKSVWVLFGVVVWVLLARKFAPEVLELLTGWVRSRVELPQSVSTKQLVTVLAEEKAVAEFRAALHGGLDEEASPAEAGGIGPALEMVRAVRRFLQDATRSDAPGNQRNLLRDAADRVLNLKNMARPAELMALRQMACALEMLLKQMTEKSVNVTSSTLRTANIGAAILEGLCQPGIKHDLLTDPPLRVLAVDDEMFSRCALVNSLKRGLNEPEVADRGDTALEMASRQTYDLIVLDVQMPGMDGFELCAKIHETEANRTTPVMFVTSLRDFDARANSILCGGRDLIAKPFLTFELTVKALSLVVSERLRGRGCLSENSVEAPKPVPAPAVELPAEILEPVRETVAKRTEPVQQPALEGFMPTPGTFFADALGQVAELQIAIDEIQKTVHAETQSDKLGQFFVRVHALSQGAEQARQHSIALVTASLEKLVKKTLKDGPNRSPSALPTAATAVNLLIDLCVSQAAAELALDPPIRVLAVDDDPVALRAISNALQRTFSKPDTACNGTEGFALAARKRYDVIFMDVQMPDMNGFEVCTRIHESGKNRLTPVIFLSSREVSGLIDIAGVAGGSDVISKSCAAAELDLKALTFALRQRLQTSRAVPQPVDQAELESAAVPG